MAFSSAPKRRTLTPSSASVGTDTCVWKIGSNFVSLDNSGARSPATHRNKSFTHNQSRIFQLITIFLCFACYFVVFLSLAFVRLFALIDMEKSIRQKKKRNVEDERIKKTFSTETKKGRTTPKKSESIDSLVLHHHPRSLSCVSECHRISGRAFYGLWAL